MSIAHIGFTGTLARSAPSLPGPVDWSTSSARTDAPALSITGAAPAAGMWFRLPQGEYDWLPKPVPQAIRSFRIALAGESEAGDHRVLLTTHDHAREAAAWVAPHPYATAHLPAPGGVSDVKLVAWTAAQLYAGDLKLLWRDRMPPPAEAKAKAEQRQAPAAPRAAPSPPPPAETTPDLDADAVAANLQMAANDGIPFCEECTKAAEASQNSAAPVAA